MNLLIAREGRYKVVRVNARFRAKRRLSQMGIYGGVVIEKLDYSRVVLPVKLKVKGAELVIGRGLANKIKVEKMAL